MKRYDFDAQRGIMMVEKDGFWISHDDYLAAERERDAFAERAERLHKALRLHAISTAESIDSGPWRMCALCRRKWSAIDSERHTDGCLAAPF